jgi:hypothetical protein
MKKLILGALAAATLSVPMVAAPADAQYRNRDWRTYRNYDYNRPPNTTYMPTNIIATAAIIASAA